jgi:RNA polymerase sigma-70 factor (ECF subfamily)
VATAQSEQALVGAARAGDAKAIDALLKRHQGQLYRFALKMCRDEEDAKDILQDTLLASIRALRGFRGRSSVSTWLYSIARSFCIKKRRRSKFAPAEDKVLSLESVADSCPSPDQQRGPEETVAGYQVQAAIDDAIAALSPMYREVLVLRDIEGLPAAEVGKVVGIGERAVKSRLHRARMAVRARVAPALGIGQDSAAPGRCPDILRLYSEHLEGDVSPELCAKMERHLAGCPRCRASCDAFKRTLALCRSLPKPAVPAKVRDAVRRELRACGAPGSAARSTRGRRRG